MPDTEPDIRQLYLSAGVEIVREVGLVAFRSLITLNGGAFIVLLTFLGNAQAQTQFVVSLTSIKVSLTCFLLGLLTVFVSIIATYAAAQNLEPANPKPPVPRNKLNLFFMILPIAMSAALFFAGVGTLISSVKENPSVAICRSTTTTSQAEGC